MKLLKSKKFWIWTLLIILVGGGLFYYFRPKPEVPETEEVRRGTVAETVSVTGEAVPNTYADLSFQQVGTLVTVVAKEGEQVEKGQVLATIESPVLASQLREARVALEVAEQNEMLARRDWDSLKPEEKSARKLTTEQARAQVNTARAQMINNTLRAPFSGTITNLNARVGETVGVTDNIMRLSVGSELQVEARIPESDIAELSNGMKATMTFDAFSQDEIFEATITSIDTGATITDDVVSYMITMTLDKSDVRLRDGMTANVDIESAKSADVLILSYRALERDGDQYYVNVLGADGITTERREVKIGLEGDGGEVEIKSGLKEGEKVTIGAKQKT
jgi:RND family efflux transporter MFP subunit